MIRNQKASTARLLVVAILLFCLLTGVYWLTYRGWLFAIDEVITFSSVASLIKYGTTTIDQAAFFRYWLNWSPYSKFDPGQALLAAPLYWIALQTTHLDNVQTVLTLNIWLVALTACGVFVFAVQLGYSIKISLAVALIFALASGAWPASTSFFSEPLTMLSLILAAYAISRFRLKARWYYIGVSGMALALALATRTQNIVSLPAFALYGLGSLATHHDAVVRRPRRLAIYFLLALGPIVMWAVGALSYNSFRYGNPLSTGYGINLNEAAQALRAPLDYWLVVHLVGPTHGLFVFSPIFILVIPGLILLWKRSRLEAAFIAMLSLSYIFFHAAYGGSGGGVWGHRYLLPITPFLAVCLAPVLRSIRRQKRLMASFILLVFVSLVVQLIAVSIDFSCCKVEELPEKASLKMYIDPQYSWLAAALTYLRPAGRQFAWLRKYVEPSRSEILYLALAFTIAWVGMAALILVNTVYRKKGQRTSCWRSHLIIAPIFILLASTASLVIYGNVNTWEKHGAIQMLARVSQQGHDQDTLIVVAPKEMQVSYFYGVDDYSQHYIGLDFEAPLRPEVATILATASMRRARIWMGVHGRRPGSQDNGVEAWLDQNTCKVQHEWIDDFGYLALYSRPSNLTTVVTIPPVTFGEEKEIELIGMKIIPVDVTPGDTLCVLLQWRALENPSISYKVFAQLIDQGGNWINGNDQIPYNGRRPTDSWQTQDIIMDPHGILVPTNAVDGTYQIWVGLYDPVTGRRLTTDGSDHVVLGKVRVLQDNESDPSR